MFRAGIKRHFLLLPILAGSAYFYLAHLNNVMPLEPDENRAYHFTYYSPQVYLVCSFFTHLFQNYDAPHYALGMLGILNIVLLYFLMLRVSTKETALASAFFLSVYGYALRGSKILAYPPFFIFSMLIFFHILFSALGRNKNSYYIYAGLVLGFLFTVNPSSYAVIAGLLMGTYYLKKGGGKGNGETQPLQIFMLLLAGAVFFYIFFEVYVYLRIDPATRASWQYKSYLAHTFHYQAQTKELTNLTGANGLFSFLSRFWDESVRQSVSAAYRTFFIFVSAFFGVIFILRDKNKKLTGILLASGVSFLCILILALLKVNVIHGKATLWLVFPVAVSVGYALVYGLKNTKGLRRASLMVLIIIYFGLSLAHCVNLTRAMPSLGPILNYLKENRISHRQITTLFPINRYENFKNKDATFLIPVEMNPRFGEASRAHVLINWPAMYLLYQRHGIRYYLSSGMSTEAEIGDNDIMLEHVKPVMSWTMHPMNNPYLSYPPMNYKIELYALSDIFGFAPNRILVEKMLREGTVLYSRR